MVVVVMEIVVGVTDTDVTARVVTFWTHVAVQAASAAATGTVLVQADHYGTLIRCHSR